MTASQRAGKSKELCISTAGTASMTCSASWSSRGPYLSYLYWVGRLRRAEGSFAGGPTPVGRCLTSEAARHRVYHTHTSAQGRSPTWSHTSRHV